MTAITNVQRMIREGAALTLFDRGGPAQTMVIAAEHVLEHDALIYYVAGADYTGGGHRLAYDALRAPHAFGVEVFKDGAPVAYLCPVAEDSAESVAAWAQWQAWLDAGHHEWHAENIAEELHNWQGAGASLPPTLEQATRPHG